MSLSCYDLWICDYWVGSVT